MLIIINILHFNGDFKLFILYLYDVLCSKLLNRLSNLIYFYEKLILLMTKQIIN